MKTSLVLSVVFIFLMGAVALTADTPATAPMTAPSVLVLPFQSLNGTQPWVGQAIQQSLIADLSRGGEIQPASFATPSNMPAVVDPAWARQTAQQADARYVVFGSCQVMDSNVRATGQVLDVSSGQVIGGLKANGSLQNLFSLEDALTEQARQLLPATAASTALVTTPAAPVYPTSPAPPAQQAYVQMPQQQSSGYIAQAADQGQSMSYYYPPQTSSPYVYTSPPVVYSAPVYTYSYPSYSYYGGPYFYPYIGFGGAFFFGGGHGSFHGGDHFEGHGGFGGHVGGFGGHVGGFGGHR